MAKKKAPSIHSRAARRATDIDIDTDKSLKDVQPPPRDAPHRPSVLAAQHSAGVTKKAKRGRKDKMSAKARQRHEKGLEMAAAIAERTQNKIEKSKGRGRNIQQRAKNWEEINKIAEEEKAQESDDDEEVESVKKDKRIEMDEEMDGADDETLTAPPTDNTAAPIQADEDGDEIL
ncbi:alb1 nuclear shuttling factor domain-containing [Fusarium longipes]|uniref:Alb1 nuclear shuttling factor domain-containing n=1 Tax=Fusarium longipes TaxID=694270 RepID=A0A395TBX9_9HYPO|nr:alb1 nuclear shuttling factor domain-containing [Fusarium longipes]